MFHWFYQRGKDIDIYGEFQCLQGKSWKGEIGIVEVKKKISYMIDINNKWKKAVNIWKRRTYKAKKKQMSYDQNEEEEDESKNQFNQSMVIGTNTSDRKTIK